MLSPALQNSLTFIISIVFIFNTSSFLLAQQQDQDTASNFGYIESREIPERKKETVIITKEATPNVSDSFQGNLNELQKQARIYRFQGLQAQRFGNLGLAVSFYQKARELDPGYAVVFNDLGIAQEAFGLLDEAESNYLKAITIDPKYLSPYTNLALLYEAKRDLEKAAYYWQKRAQMGSADDPWTQKAQQRFKDICMVQGKEPFESSGEKEVLGLMKDVIKQKYAIRSENRELAKAYFQKARLSYERGEEVLAIKQAFDAKELDPSNAEIDKFIEKLQTRLLTR